MKPRLYYISGIYCCLLFSAAPSYADVWHYSLFLPASVEYDSNPGMSVSNPESGMRFRLVPRARAEGVWGGDTASADVAVNVERNNSDSRFDRNDPSLGVSWGRQWQSGLLGISARYSKVAVRAATYDEVENDNSDGSRIARSLSGSWSGQLSERTTLSANVSHTQTSYQNSLSSDYSQLSLGGAFRYQFNELLTGSVSLNAGQYDSPVSQTVDSLGISAAVNGLLSERLSWSANLGVNNKSGVTSDSNYVGGLSLSYAYLKSSVSLSANRSVSDSGRGASNLSNQLSGSWSYQLDERTSFYANGTRRKTAEGSSFNTFGSGLSHELNPFLNSRIALSLRESSSAGIKAKGETLSFTITYSGLDL